MVESVEKIQSDPERDRSSAEAREVLAQTHVDVLVRERSGYREASALEVAAERECERTQGGDMRKQRLLERQFLAIQLSSPLPRVFP